MRGTQVGVKKRTDSLKVGQSETSEGSQGTFFPRELERKPCISKDLEVWGWGVTSREVENWLPSGTGPKSSLAPSPLCSSSARCSHCFLFLQILVSLLVVKGTHSRSLGKCSAGGLAFLIQSCQSPVFLVLEMKKNKCRWVI